MGTMGYRLARHGLWGAKYFGASPFSMIEQQFPQLRASDLIAMATQDLKRRVQRTLQPGRVRSVFPGRREQCHCGWMIDLNEVAMSAACSIVRTLDEAFAPARTWNGGREITGRRIASANGAFDFVVAVQGSKSPSNTLMNRYFCSITRTSCSLSCSQ